jgi:KUP system potassium uptake protein
VLGVVSLMFWALILIVTIKYVFFLMRADNKGEGRHAGPDGPGAAGAGPPLGDDLRAGRVRRRLLLRRRHHHPAISVLSAMEGPGGGSRGSADCWTPTSCR